MYRVYVTNQDGKYPIYEPLDDTLRIFDPVLTQGMGSANMFEFQIFQNHPYYHQLKLFESEIIVYDDEEAIFYGRMFRPQQAFDNVVQITCEGEMTYMLDSRVRPFSHTGNLSDYIGQLIAIHNSQVDISKRFERGNIVVTGDGGYREWIVTENVATLTLLRQLSKEYGGYLRVRHNGNKRFLDLVWDYGGINSQVIRFGENLLDLTHYIDASQIITCLIPQGAQVEYRDALGEKQTRVVDITSVNGGQDYIENAEAVRRYGKIWGYQRWEDVTEPENLLAKARAYLQEASALPEGMEIAAIDLALIDSTIQQFQVGYWTEVISEPHGINQKFLLSRRIIHLLDPSQGKIILGKQTDTMTEATEKVQVELSSRIQKVAENASQEINRRVENATSLITGGFGGYVVLDVEHPETGEKMHPWRILVMNTPDKNTAQNVIQINQNGLGFSTTGINGPYRNAWTIDGNLVADFITAGTMLADRVRGGTLEVGGSGIGRDGQIVVKDVNNQVIGYWDKTGLHVYRGVLRGPEIIGGSIEIGDGLFYAGDDGVSLGDYYISSNGTNELISSNGYVKIDCKDRPAGSPGLEYAALHLGGGGYGGVEILGTGQINCGGIRSETIECYDIKFPQSSWADGWSLLRMLKDLYDRVNNLENT